MSDNHHPPFSHWDTLRRELSGAFGDLGTDLPLLLGLVTLCGLGVINTFVVFGLFQILCGIFYRIPVPVQPLKLLAATAILHSYGSETLFAAGLTLGIAMLLIAMSGILPWLFRITPLPVIRGIQAGLGLTLFSLALRKFILPFSLYGWILAGIPLLLSFLPASFPLPSGLLVLLIASTFVLLDIFYPGLLSITSPAVESRIIPLSSGILQGALPDLTLVLSVAIPQLALSVTNAVLSTQRLILDCFPLRQSLIPFIPRTYALMNLIAPFLGAPPCCHGSSGLVGHYRFGARSGLSLVFYGTFLAFPALFAPHFFVQYLQRFPLPLLGGLLLVEGSGLILLLRDQMGLRILLGIGVAFVSFLLPWGFLLALVIGILLHKGMEKIVPFEVIPSSPSSGSQGKGQE